MKNFNDIFKIAQQNYEQLCAAQSKYYKQQKEIDNTVRADIEAGLGLKLDAIQCNVRDDYISGHVVIGGYTFYFHQNKKKEALDLILSGLRLNIENSIRQYEKQAEEAAAILRIFKNQKDDIIQ